MEENEKNFIEKIEQLNNEYLSSGEYALGIYVRYLYSLLKKKNLYNL